MIDMCVFVTLSVIENMAIYQMIHPDMADINQLIHIRNKPERLIIGLMSGTSIDGLDIALCRFRAHGEQTEYEVLEHTTVSYSARQSGVLRDFATQEYVRMEDLTIYHAELSRWHAGMILNTLKKWGVDPSEVDLMASHGQTIRHAPRRIHGKPDLPDSTLQLGDGDHLAELTGIITISDFRQKHVAAGGEGAPLAGYGDALLFRDQEAIRVLLNVGGISNITLLAPDSSATELPLTFDTGPGNTLMDVVVRTHFPTMKYDEGGALSASGSVHQQLLSVLLQHPYLAQMPPKTTGPEAFSSAFLEESVGRAQCADIHPTDLLATLNRFTAETIADGIRLALDSKGLDHASCQVFISGGGAHNATLVQNLSSCMPGNSVSDFSRLGVHPDAKEALLFALFANELVMGGTFPVADSNGAIKQVALGKISLPG